MTDERKLDTDPGSPEKNDTTAFTNSEPAVTAWLTIEAAHETAAEIAWSNHNFTRPGSCEKKFPTSVTNWLTDCGKPVRNSTNPASESITNVTACTIPPKRATTRDRAAPSTVPRKSATG